MINGTTITNHQITITTQAPNSNDRISNRFGYWSLGIGDCLVFGIWVLVCAAPAVLAEDMTVETYYPSPRGVYQELRTTNNTYLATLAGNVGIGTTASEDTLVLSNSIDYSIRMIHTAPGGREWHLSNVALDLSGAPPRFRIWDHTARAERFSILGNGNVGIGTTGANFKLEVVGPAGSNAIVTHAPGVGSGGLAAGLGGVPGISLSANNGENIRFGHAPYTGDWNTNFSENMRIDSAGNVGIGTTSPDYNLHVHKDTGNVAILITQGDGTSGNPHLLFGSQYNVSTKWALLGMDTANNVFKLVHGGSVGAFAANSNGIMIAESGNVGIGTTAPTLPLVIRAAPTSQSAGWEPLLGFEDASGNLKWHFNRGQPSLAIRGLNVVESGVADYRLFIQEGSGNVGIGTSGPATKLDVSGDIHATGTISVASDARFKEDLRPLTGILPKLAQLHALSYRPRPLVPSNLEPRTSNLEPARQLGLLGQELEQVFPELVTTHGPEAYRAVDYSRLTVVLLEAIKEQQHQIEAQRQELEAQREQFESLKVRLAGEP